MSGFNNLCIWIIFVNYVVLILTEKVLYNINIKHILPENYLLSYLNTYLYLLKTKKTRRFRIDTWL